MPDELDRWAARRAPELLERAEAEAVQELTRALLKATLQHEAQARREPPRPVAAEPPAAADASPRPARPEPTEPGATAPTGDGLWAYCITRASDPPRIDGVHGASVARVEADGLAVLVSRVPLAEFGEDALRRNLNDLDWLERVAREHETVLEKALAGGTIVPLRICTIFSDERGRRAHAHRAALARSTPPSTSSTAARSGA